MEASTIRFYERRQLLVPQVRKPSGYRLYAPDTVQRVRFIRDAQALGLSLEEVAELLALAAEEADGGLVTKQRAARKLSAINERIERLQQIRSALQAILDGRRGGPLWTLELAGPQDSQAR